MKSYGQFCPVAKAAEIFAERWTPLVLRELFCGSVRFNELRRGVPLMSPSLLSRRLKELEQAGIVTRTQRRDARAPEYHLTEAGQELRPLVDQLGVWGKRWTRAQLEKRDLDAGLLMWDLRGNLSLDCLPCERTVLKFEFAGTTSGKKRWWLIADNGEIDLCLLDPGFPVDLVVRTHLRTMTEIRLGDRSCEEAIRTRALLLEGPPHLARAFPELFTKSPLATIERQVRA